MRFTVYDPTANFDIHSARILDFIYATNSKRAIKQANKDFAGKDFVICDNTDMVIYTTQGEE